MQVKVIDNFLPIETFHHIQNLLVSEKFQWHYVDHVATPTNDEDFYYVHHFYSVFSKPARQSEWFPEVVQPILDRMKVPFNKLMRARTNLYTKKYERLVADFHVDYDHSHIVGLFSLNTNNGFTLFDDGQRFYSVANRMLIFDGSQRHASVPQTDTNIRYNINLNFEPIQIDI